MTTWPKHCPSRNRLNMCTCQLRQQVKKRILPVLLSSILRATFELLGEASGLISLVLVFNPPWPVSTSRFGIVKWRLGAGLSLLSPAVFGLDSLLWTIWEKSASITKTTSLQQLPWPIFSQWKLDLLLRIIPVIRLMALIAWPHLDIEYHCPSFCLCLRLCLRFCLRLCIFLFLCHLCQRRRAKKRLRFSVLVFWEMVSSLVMRLMEDDIFYLCFLEFFWSDGSLMTT